VFLLVHVMIFHYRPPVRRFRSMVYMVIIVLAGYTLVFLLLAGTKAAAAINALMPLRLADPAAGLCVYFFFYFAYFHQVIVFDRSVTPRIMIEIMNAEGGRIDLGGLKKNYSMEDKFKRELTDMVYMERMEEKGGVYSNTPKGRHHAFLMQSLRDFMHIGGHQ